MNNWINWTLVIGGILCVVVELALGALTGFDLALVGASLALGGALGLFTASEKIGLLSAGILCFIYFAAFRSWLKARLQVKHETTNVDAVVGKTGTVTRKIEPRCAGTVKVGSEEWRAEVATVEDGTRDKDSVVTVVAVDGVTLKVR